MEEPTVKQHLLATSNLQAVPKRLQGQADYEKWAENVQDTLDISNSWKFVNTATSNTLDHTKPLERQLDKTILLWIKLQCSDNVTTMVKESGLSILTARDYFAAIKASAVRGGFNNQADAYFEFISIRRTDYSTLDQFLAAFNTRYMKAKECNMGTTPAQSIVHLVRSLTDELPSWTALVRTT
ncbi:hypothetical protein EJ08DRAFT_720215 [Tothia fuscella]|uniref:Uncharacterized protein n=1 Tax=Tothia fuscella TaxID=1048955 RepID=A0A9P4U3W0_9PEZI|nr:hypothetical protein EJ08DRAFT_720215 [Tothia fuscella]